jgi:hypothetical protein
MGSRPHSHDLGMSRRINVAQNAILAARNDLASNYDNSADGYLACGCCQPRLVKPCLHERFILHADHANGWALSKSESLAAPVGR